MKVNILLNQANRSWILDKIAERLARELVAFDVQVHLTDTVDGKADIVHHMSWAFANIPSVVPSTMFVTHLDDPYKINQVISTLKNHVNVGVCMSMDTMRLLETHGCPARSLTVISPAHDGVVKPRRIVIGITSRVYSDGRKREHLLQAVAERMSLRDFTFRIFGQGWEPTIFKLERAGATVEYFGESSDFRKDYDALVAAIPSFDYYLYLGLDEGSLGTLDALAAGVPTIITPQGFHLDLEHGITYPVLTDRDLQSVFEKIIGDRRERIASVSRLTWTYYARCHLALWEDLIAGKNRDGSAGGLDAPPAALGAMERYRNWIIRANAFNVKRLLAALSHLPSLQSWRRAVDRRRLRR
jgi:glycosyltransferase involved in cell wall biosynthesis